MTEADALGADSSNVDPFTERALAWRPRLLSLVGRHDEAIGHAERLLAAERSTLRDDIATSVLAGVLADAGQYERAAITADRALERWRADGAPELFGMADALRARATIDRQARDFASAAEHLEQAETILDGQVAHLVRVLVVIECAELEAATGHAAEAVRRLDRLDIDARTGGGDRRLTDKIAAARHAIAADANPAAAAPAPASRPARAPTGQQNLTDRELVVLRFLASHLTLPELASELLVSRNTIKTQVAAVYRKLGASSRSEAVDLGRQLGLVGSGR
jgi:LuxR family maltose regulon positive regulatory protein